MPKRFDVCQKQKAIFKFGTIVIVHFYFVKIVFLKCQNQMSVCQKQMQKV